MATDPANKPAKAATPKKPTKPAAEKKPAPPSDAELAELGLNREDDGKCAVKMLTGASGEGFSLKEGETYRADPEIAVRWVRAHVAKPRHAKA